MLAGIQAAQMCRSEEEIPNDLLPINKRVGTVRPMSGPATYQGHGLRMSSMNCSMRDLLVMVIENKIEMSHIYFVEYITVIIIRCSLFIFTNYQ